MGSEWNTVIISALLYLVCGAYWIGWGSTIGPGEGKRTNQKASDAEQLENVA